MTDFRVTSYREAAECLRLVREQKPDQPEFWANLLGAIANATMAALPDSVANEVVVTTLAERAKRQKLQNAIQKELNRKLSDKKK